jgi:hypothetical protein
VQPTGNFTYTVNFENEATATAPAPAQTVTEQLDPNLDWSTFLLGDIGFGNFTVSVPPGRTSFSTRVDATATLGVFVDVTASFNVQTGLVTWTFTGLDPTTLDLPMNPRVGFLPPNKNAPQGRGFASYTVNPKTGLATGTAINAQATVVFDTNPPVNTAPRLNTIDVGTPTSSVIPLSPVTNSTSFTVSWSGSEPGGPAIASYDVYVSVDGGAFSPWLTGTSQTSAVYSGAFGHRYAFYSVATDPLGFRQPTPTAAQASTVLEPLPAPVTGDVTNLVSWTFAPASGSKKHRAGGFVGLLTIRNTSEELLEGPFNVVLRGLKGRVKVRGASGSVGTRKRKSPFLVIPVPGGSLQPGASVSTTLRLSGKPNRFTLSVFAATPPR